VSNQTYVYEMVRRLERTLYIYLVTFSVEGKYIYIYIYFFLKKKKNESKAKNEFVNCISLHFFFFFFFCKFENKQLLLRKENYKQN